MQKVAKEKKKNIELPTEAGGQGRNKRKRGGWGQGTSRKQRRTQIRCEQSLECLEVEREDLMFVMSKSNSLEALPSLLPCSNNYIICHYT